MPRDLAVHDVDTRHEHHVTPCRRLTAFARARGITIAVVGGSMLCAGAPEDVTALSSVAAAAATDPGAPATDATTTVAPAPETPAPAPADPAPDPSAATPPPADPPGAPPSVDAPAAAPADQPQTGPTPVPQFWPKAPKKRTSPPSQPADRSTPGASACLSVSTTLVCEAPQRDLPQINTNGRRRAQTPVTEAAAEANLEPATGQVPSAALGAMAPSRIPNVFIDRLRIPPFLLSIYQAAGIQYGIRWEILAAINEVETDYGRNLNISSAGALGWMQFMPSSWTSYGVDANADGRKDPFNPVDAIFAAARYLKAAGADQDLRKAIFAYNHADWYVNLVLERARFIGGIPEDLVSALTGLSQGRLPVAARARYGSQKTKRTLRGLDVLAAPGAPVVAVQDGQIVRVGHSKRLGRFVMLRDVYGNTYTYARLKTVARQVPVPKDKRQTKASIAKELALPAPDPAPTEPASAGSNKRDHTPAVTPPAVAPPLTAPAGVAAAQPSSESDPAAVEEAPAKERLFAHPGRPRALRAGGRTQILQSWAPLPDSASLRSYLTGSYGLERSDVVLKRLVPGRKVIAGTILGRIGTNPAGTSAHMRFEIRPAGRGAPRVDPRPVVRSWRLRDSAAIDRARSVGALGRPTLGQILLMSKGALEQRVLNNPAIEIYECGRRDIQAGAVDRRVLATLEFLAASDLRPTVTSLNCGHGFYTAGGSVSAHSSGAAVDIAKINGKPILGNQGPGSVADETIRRLLSLQGALEPAQIISLMTYEGAVNTLALADHADHIHVGFRAQLGPLAANDPLGPGALRPSQWTRLIGRLDRIPSPKVALAPSRYAIKVTRPPAAGAARRSP